MQTSGGCKKPWRPGSWLWIMFAAGLATLPVWAAAPDAPLVICTTTHLSALVRTLAGDQLQVETIVPWGMCPGHFELKRGQIEKLRSAGLILRHGYEQFLAPFENNPDYAPLATVDVPGNWMIPAVQQRAAEQTAAILAAKFPRAAGTLCANLAAYHIRLNALEKEGLAALAGRQGQAVVCAALSADYVAWTGWRVVAEFPRDEDLSLRSLQDVLQQARQAGARLVIDNHQSSGKTGRTLARELAVPLVLISSFPEPDNSGQYSYEATQRKNILALEQRAQAGD